jgi:hypothetical protein
LACSPFLCRAFQLIYIKHFKYVLEELALPVHTVLWI